MSFVALLALFVNYVYSPQRLLRIVATAPSSKNRKLPFPCGTSFYMRSLVPDEEVSQCKPDRFVIEDYISESIKVRHCKTWEKDRLYFLSEHCKMFLRSASYEKVTFVVSKDFAENLQKVLKTDETWYVMYLNMMK